MLRPNTVPHHDVVIVGAGQAGLAMSYWLTKRKMDHVIFERHRIAHAWRNQRWDSFCLVTPNWQCRLPDFPYSGDDPHGFIAREAIVEYVESYARKIDAPVREGVAVTRLTRRAQAEFLVETSAGAATASAVVLAVSGYHKPKVPATADRLPETVRQVHSSAYRNSAQLAEGAVLVVGSGQSGCQIAEDLHLAGRQVHLVVGSAPRCPRFYRGRDAVDWLADLGQYDLPVEEHPLKEGVRKNANHYLTGRDGGRDIDLRKFALEGMRLYGRLQDIEGAGLKFGDDLAKNLDAADAVYNGICGLIDKHIADRAIAAPEAGRYEPLWRPGPAATELDLEAAGISAIVWATGFRSDWSWVDLPFLDGSGYPNHRRGVTSAPGLYVLGLPWLHTWGSGRFVGVGRDAEYIADQIERLGLGEAEGLRATG